MPLTETVAMSGVRAAGLDYGRMRLWGSLSFIAASFCGGWVVERLGPGAVIWLIVVGGALMTAGRARAQAADRARPPQGRDQCAAARPRRRARACCARASSSSCWRPAAPCRPRTPCSTPSARCTGARSGPVGGMVRHAVGHLGHRRDRAVCLLRRGGARASAPAQLIGLGAAAAVRALDWRWASIRRSPCWCRCRSCTA